MASHPLDFLLYFFARVRYLTCTRMITKGTEISDDGGTPKLPSRRRERAWIGRALCFAAAVLVANALIGERGLSETLRARREFRQTIAELSRLQYENATLADQIRRLRHDARTIEGVARAELGLIKPGEILVVVKAPTP
jgi:cell division protein FtsB